MAFNYGKYNYGQALYSLKPILDLVGTLSFVPTLFGKLDRILQSLQGGFSFAMTPAGRLSASIGTLQGGLAFTTAWSGILRNNAAFSGDLPINMVLFGDLFRSAQRDLQGNLFVDVTFGGALGVQLPLEGDPLDFTIDILGGADIYLGPLWKPDGPQDGFWVPDVPVNEFWVPSEPDSIPNDPGLNYGINAYGGEHYGRLSTPVPLNIWKPIPMERSYHG